MTPGLLFKKAIEEERPLQVIGTINAYHAKLAEKTGYKAIYLSGGGVAAGSLGVPDLGISTLEDVLIDIRRITDSTSLPLLVDVDTGFGGAFNIARTIRSVEKSGAAAVHIEDQIQAKRCGHRPNMIFPEAINDLDTYKKFTKSVDVPVLANITEFGATPLFSLDELDSVDIAIALYPLSAFRAMNKAALNIYKGLREEGTQKNLVEQMQTREELYEFLDYHEYEKKLDQLFKKEKN